MLIIERTPDEAFRIGEDILVRILRVKGKKVIIGIDAPKNILILRTELEEKINDGEKNGNH